MMYRRTKRRLMWIWRTRLTKESKGLAEERRGMTEESGVLIEVRERVTKEKKSGCALAVYLRRDRAVVMR